MEKELRAPQDAQRCQREGAGGKHKADLAGTDTQSAIRGGDGGPTGSEWLAFQNFQLEGWTQGGHYGAQTWTQPRLVACARYRQNGGGITFQNHWDDPPPARFTGIPDPEYFLPTTAPEAGSLKA